MTLAAAILFIGFFFTSTDATLVAQSAPQSNPSVGTENIQQPPSAQTSPDSTKPSSSQTSSNVGAKKPKESAAKKTQQKKKVVPEATCDPAPSNAGSPGSNNSPASEQPGSPQAPVTPEPQNNCPPQKKKVVRQGGITEQSIQLAGGSSGGEATQKRESTNQMLTATEQNLKKVAAIQLSTTQRNSVSQIRQFVDQSKKALQAADFERAQTLAWKAKVLSDDLVTPK